MVSLTTLALVIGGISFMTFVTFFGRLPVLRRTPIAWLHRFIWVILPNAVLSADDPARWLSEPVTGLKKLLEAELRGLRSNIGGFSRGLVIGGLRERELTPVLEVSLRLLPV